MVEHLAWIRRFCIQIPPGVRHFLLKLRLFLKNIHSSVGNECCCQCIVEFQMLTAKILNIPGSKTNVYGTFDGRSLVVVFCQNSHITTHKTWRGSRADSETEVKLIIQQWRFIALSDVNMLNWRPLLSGEMRCWRSPMVPLKPKDSMLWLPHEMSQQHNVVCAHTFYHTAIKICTDSIWRRYIDI